jgi:hypothetical protein
VLRDRQAELTAKGVYNLTKLATGDEGEAQDAMSHRIMDDMRNERKSEF